MTASANSNLLARILDWIKACAIRGNELATLSRGDLQLLASDIGVTDADLREIVQQASDHGDLMDRMMWARGLDPVAMRRVFGSIVRDMEVTCARCREAGVCRRELEAGTAGVNSHEFCPNAAVLDDLLDVQT